MNNTNMEEELFPKVTVVTVTYNLIKNGREQYFRQCLESVHKQIYSNVEHIVIDGASNDGTLDILKEYQKKKWITYYSEPDNGIYDAMNKGIKKATGKYVVFLNSDDFFYKESAISLSIRSLENEQADFSCAYGYYIENEKISSKINVQPEIFFLRMPFCHQTMFTRRDVLLKEGCFDAKKYKSAADYDLIIRLLLKGYTISIVNKVISCFRGGGTSGIDIETSKKEVHLIMKKYFSRTTEIHKKALKNYRYGTFECVYSISKDTLNMIKNKVCPRMRQMINHLRPKEINNDIYFFPRGYFIPLIWKIKLFGLINIFSFNYIEHPVGHKRWLLKLFGIIKFFEVKDNYRYLLFRILYLTILKIKRH